MNKRSASVGILLFALLFTLSSGYAQEKQYEDVLPSKAYEMLKSGDARMIDVRSPEEWDLIGHPGENKAGEGRELAGKVFFIPWNSYAGQHNEEFVSKVKELFPNPETPLLLLCRVGNRSVSAAKALHAVGYKNLYNIKTGFEGEPDPKGYRNLNGWKVEGLPYKHGRPS
jgi:rhodanese-related sulfurtransferase